MHNRTSAATPHALRNRSDLEDEPDAHPAKAPEGGISDSLAMADVHWGRWLRVAPASPPKAADDCYHGHEEQESNGAT